MAHLSLLFALFAVQRVIQLGVASLKDGGVRLQQQDKKLWLRLHTIPTQLYFFLSFFIINRLYLYTMALFCLLFALFAM
jgi:hypothetical protein